MFTWCQIWEEQDMVFIDWCVFLNLSSLEIKCIVSLGCEAGCKQGHLGSKMTKS